MPFSKQILQIQNNDETSSIIKCKLLLHNNTTTTTTNDVIRVEENNNTTTHVWEYENYFCYQIRKFSVTKTTDFFWTFSGQVTKILDTRHANF